MMSAILTCGQRLYPGTATPMPWPLRPAARWLNNDGSKLPPAAVDEHRQRGVGASIEQVDYLAGRRAVADARLPRRRQAGAVGRRIRRPSGKDLGVLRHPRPIVVFGFVIDCGHRDALRGTHSEARRGGRQAAFLSDDRVSLPGLTRSLACDDPI